MNFNVVKICQVVLYCIVICLTHCVSVEDPCRNNGICIYPEPEIPGQLPRCQCLPGFYGDICEFDVNECQVRRINCNNRGESFGLLSTLCLCTMGSYTSRSDCMSVVCLSMTGPNFRLDKKSLNQNSSSKSAI